MRRGADAQADRSGLALHAERYLRRVAELALVAELDRRLALQADLDRTGALHAKLDAGLAVVAGLALDAELNAGLALHAELDTGLALGAKQGGTALAEGALDARRAGRAGSRARRRTGCGAGRGGGLLGGRDAEGSDAEEALGALGGSALGGGAQGGDRRLAQHAVLAAEAGMAGLADDGLARCARRARGAGGAGSRAWGGAGHGAALLLAKHAVLAAEAGLAGLADRGLTGGARRARRRTGRGAGRTRRRAGRGTRSARRGARSTGRGARGGARYGCLAGALGALHAEDDDAGITQRHAGAAADAALRLLSLSALDAERRRTGTAAELPLLSAGLLAGARVGAGCTRGGRPVGAATAGSTVGTGSTGLTADPSFDAGQLVAQLAHRRMDLGDQDVEILTLSFIVRNSSFVGHDAS